MGTIDYSVYLNNLDKTHVSSGRQIHTNKGRLTVHFKPRGWVAQADGNTDPVAGPVSSEQELVDKIKAWAWKH